jgi:Putative auto-transporter adhesin, head GIN domain
MVKLEWDIVSKSLVAMLLASFTLWSCNKENAPDIIKAAGPVVKVQREVSTFSELALYDNIDYELIDTNFCALEIEAPKNLIPKITSNVDGQVLTIENTNTCNFVRSYQNRIIVRVYFNSLHYIENHCTGSVITTSPLFAPVFTIDNKHSNGQVNLQIEGDSVTCNSPTGAAEVWLSGHTRKVLLYSNSYGIIHANTMHAQQAYINNSSLQPIYASATDYVFALIEYSGNIELTGTPSDYDYVRIGEGILIIH